MTYWVKKLVLALAVTAPVAHAANLVQFSAGQPAKAAEVNANFKALNDELAAAKNFSDLTEAQIQALKNAVGAGGVIDGLQVDCTEDPAALVNVIETKGRHNQFMRVTIKGDCHAVMTTQFHGFNLFINGDEAGARLIPDPDAVQKWNLLGGFNGGLYLNNLTLLPPSDADAVLFSRSSQGSLTNVTIEGGSNGVVVQATAQVYLTNVKIRNTSQTGISAYTGGSLRFTGNSDNSALIETHSGIGLLVDLAGASMANTEIKAPVALELRNGGTLAVNFGRQLILQGSTRMFTGGQLSAQDIAVTGSILMRQASLFADRATIVGNTRLFDGAQFTVLSGSMRATDPPSANYDEHMVLEVSGGSQATLGRHATQMQLDVTGYLVLNNARVSALWTQLNTDLNMEASSFSMEKSNFLGLARDANNPYQANLSSNSTWRLFQSNVSAGKVLLMQSTLNIDGESGNNNYGNTANTYFQLAMGSSLRAANCKGNSYFNLEGSSLQLLDCDFTESVVSAHTGSKARIDRSKIGLVHVDGGSTAGFYQSKLTGAGFTDWGDQNYNIGANSMMYLDGSSLTVTKHFNNNGVLRLQNASVDMKNSTVQCYANRGFIEWWSATAASTIGVLSGCNSAPAP